MVANLELTIKLMDVVIAYLFGNLDSEIYMKALKGIPILNQDRENCGLYSVLLKNSLYRLKQSGRMW